LHSHLSTVGNFAPRPLGDDGLSTLAISVKGIATTGAAPYLTVGEIIQPSIALASTQPIN
jgi:hypothetical protein